MKLIFVNNRAYRQVVVVAVRCGEGFTGYWRDLLGENVSVIGCVIVIVLLRKLTLAISLFWKILTEGAKK